MHPLTAAALDMLPAVILSMPASAILAALAYAAHRLARRGEHGQLDDVLPPTQHEGATEQWRPAADVAAAITGDPLTCDLADITLDVAPLYAELARMHGVDVAWMPESFTATWSRVGTELERMGETQTMPRIEA